MDEGNYTVNPEANGKHNNPIWILIAVLIATRVGGRRGEGSGGSNIAKGRIQEWEKRPELWGGWKVEARGGAVEKMWAEWSDMS